MWTWFPFMGLRINATGCSILKPVKPEGPMAQARTADRWLVLLLRTIGGLCLLALVALWMPRSWIDVGHRWLGWGAFPAAPVAEYLARSVSALSAFYGGLLIALSFDVKRYIPLIRYQAVAIMLLSACGVVVGGWAGVPRWFVGGDALACWAYGIPMLVLAWRADEGCAAGTGDSESR
jgi:hypothetical protein